MYCKLWAAYYLQEKKDKLDEMNVYDKALGMTSALYFCAAPNPLASQASGVSRAESSDVPVSIQNGVVS